MDRQLETNGSNGKVGPALSNVIMTGQQLLADRVELALLDGQKALSRMAVNAALLLLAGLLFLGAVVVADVALVDYMAVKTSRVFGLVSCSVLHLLLAAGLVVYRVRRRG